MTSNLYTKLKKSLHLIFLFFTISLLAQPGKDGNLTVSTTNVVVNTYTNLSSNAFAGQTSIQVGSASALSPTLGAGDLIMIYQAQGATIQTTDDKDYGKILDYNGAGNYEYQYVKSVVGNTIYLNCALTQKYIVSGRTQVLKVPQYDILTINSGASIVPLTWNGTIGGIIAIHAKNRIINNGTIRAAGFGFRGGDKENLTLGNTTANNAANFIYRSLNPAEGGEKGESIAGYQTDYDAPGMGGRYGRGAPANGGGGGNAHNSAGGGGANGDNGKVYSGAGVMDPNPLYYDAWRLDPDFILNGNTLTNSSGGGRGGYTYSANVQNPLTLGPSYAQIIDGVTTIPAVANTAWGGDGRKANGGRGGRPLSTDPEKRIFIGGGGGAGDGNNNTNQRAGNGGGIIYLISRNVVGTGLLTADGETAPPNPPVNASLDASSGGGGGGTIIVKSQNFVGLTLSANGGAGGNQSCCNGNESEGVGGGGGGGFIGIPNKALGLCGASNSYTYIYGTNGLTFTPPMVLFPPNGGTNGGSGQINVPVSPFFQYYSPNVCGLDWDNDGISDLIDIDDDNDGILDAIEGYQGIDGSADADGNGFQNAFDPSFLPYLDVNCDGVNDYFDYDLDGNPDFIDFDSDNDGITDCIEGNGTDANKDGVIDGFVDVNQDGLADFIYPGLTVPDSDNDGITNQRDRDSDADGLTDLLEAGGTDGNGDGTIDNFVDSDYDGFADPIDRTTNNLALSGGNASGNSGLAVADTDADFFANYIDADSDNDGITDNVEGQTTLNYIAPSGNDNDNNGVDDIYQTNTLSGINTDNTDTPDYMDLDSDNDGVSDRIEGNDANSDGIASPAYTLSGDSDGDGIIDIYDNKVGVGVGNAGMGNSGSLSILQDSDADGLRDWRDTDDDNDCILTSTTGVSGENTNSNASWSDDFSQLGSPIPNYLFSAIPFIVPNNSRCGTGTVTLTATASVSGIFSWYNASVGGTLLLSVSGATVSNFTTPSLTTTTSYWITYQGNSCLSSRKMVQAIILDNTVIPTTGASRCGSGSVVLQSNAPIVGTTSWFANSVGGAALYTSTGSSFSAYTTPGLASNTTYYVSVSNGTCSSIRSAVTATVASSPTFSLLQNGNSCGSNIAVVTAAMTTTGIFRWYSASVGGVLLQVDNNVSIANYTFTGLISDTDVWVEFENIACLTTRSKLTGIYGGAIANPTVINGTACSSTATGVTLTSTNSITGTFTWYSSSVGGSALSISGANVTTSSFITPAISVSTPYFVEFSNGACVTSRKRVDAYVINSSLITAQNVNACGASTFPSTYTNGILGASSPLAGQFSWYNVSTGGAALSTSASSVTGSNYNVPSLNITGSIGAFTVTGTTRYWVSLSVSSCNTSRVPVDINVTPSPTLVTTSRVLCTPGSVVLTVTSNVAGTLRWYDVSSNGNLLLTGTGTSLLLTTPSLNTFQQFWAEQTYGSCTTVRSSANANLIFNFPIGINDAYQCGTGSLGLGANYPTAGTFGVYATTSGGASLATSAANSFTYTYNTPSISTTTTYYFDITITGVGGSCTSPRSPGVANVLLVPQPTAINGTRCGTGTVELSALTSVLGTVNWYANSTGGAALSTSYTNGFAPFTTPSISSTTTYWVDFVNSFGTGVVCTSTPRIPVVATVTSTSVGTALTPIVTGTTVCGITNSALTASTTATGVFRWYNTSVGGTPLLTQINTSVSSFNLNPVTASGTLFVLFDNNSCQNPIRVSGNYILNSIPGVPTTTDADRCGTGSLILSANTSLPGIHNWYTVASGGTPIYSVSGTTISNYTTTSLATSTAYYVEVFDGKCASSRNNATANILSVPNAPTITNGTICGNNSANLSASNTLSGIFRWYTSSIGGSLLQTSGTSLSNNYTTPIITTTSQYFVDIQVGSCTGTRALAQAIVNSATGISSVVNGQRCGIGSITLTANAPQTGTFTWYSLSVGGALLFSTTGTSVSNYTFTISTSGNYFVEFNNGNCTSIRTVVSAIVNPTPSIISVLSSCTGSGIRNITVTSSITSGILEYNRNGGAFQPSNQFIGVNNAAQSIIVRETTSLCTATFSGALTTCNSAPIAPVNTFPGVVEDVLFCSTITGYSDPENVVTVTAGVYTTTGGGSITISGNGLFCFNPGPNVNGGPINVPYTVCDPFTCTSSNIQFTVAGVNDPPVLNPDFASVTVGGTVLLSVLTNDSDVDGTLLGSNLTILTAIPTTTGTISVNTSTGIVSFTGNSTFTGIVSFVYQACDNGTPLPSICRTTTGTISVTGTPPIANPDVTTTGVNTPVAICVLCNDTGGPLNISSVTISGIPTVPGTLSVNTTTGIITLTPNATFVGITTFTYQVCSKFPISCTSANVTVTVTGTPPFANPDVTTTGRNTPVGICVMCNDTGGPLNPATVTISGIPTVPGTFAVNTTTGVITFSPNATFVGITTFTYQVCTYFPVSCTSTNVTVSVTGAPPIANPDVTTTGINTPVTICVLCNDAGGPLNPASVTVPASTVPGTLTVNSTTGAITFSPNVTFVGITTFIYQVCSLFPVSCTSANVTISVTGTPPVANPDVTTTGVNTPVAICVLCNDTGGPLNVGSLTISGIPTVPGTLSVNTTTGIITLTPNATFVGITTFTYQVCSIFPISCTSANVIVTVTGTPPFANPDVTTTGRNTPIGICVLCNDTGGPLNPASVTVSGIPTVPGTFAVNTTTGVITFSPNATFVGITTFTYLVCTYFPVSCTSTNVTVSVTGAPPIANPDVTTTGINTPVTICVLCNDAGGPLNPASVTVPASTVPGTLSVNSTTGAITFSPNATFVGITTFTYQVCSLFPVSCTSANVTISVTGTPPVANPDVTTTGVNTPVAICVLCNDTGGPLNVGSVTISGIPTVPGTFSVNTTTGLITLTPNATFVGITTFTYQVCSIFPISCTSANVMVTVTGTPPFANPDVTTTGRNTPVGICVLCNDTGGPLNPATVTISGIPTVPGTFAVSTTTGVITFSPNATFVGITTFTYQVCTYFPVSCTSANVTVSVTGAPPVANPEVTTTGINTPVNICVLCNDAGGPLNPASVTVPASTLPGILSVNTLTGEITFTPNSTFVGITTFDYQVCSLFPVSCTSANVTISVTGTPPVANPDVTTTGVNTPVAICVLCNDMGGPLDPASVIIVSSTVPGTLSVNTTTGEITFSPNSTFVGTTQFTYQVCSLFPISCVSNIVSITVTGNAPIANPDVTTTGKNTPTDICVLCNDTGGPLNPASVTVSGVTTVPGTFAVNTTTGIITFTPNATFVGITTFTYQVCTYFPISCTSANVTVSVTGAPPIANPDVTSTGINTPVNICVLCNDAGGPLNPSSVSVPVSTVPGTLTVNSTTGAITFTPNATFSGITTFNYQVCSLFLVSCTSTNVTISVTGNVPPVLKPDTNNTPFNGPITICGLQNDMDVDGSLDNSSVQVFAITPIEAGTISIIGTSGCFVFTPNGTFTGPVNYKYRVCDNGSPQACATTTGVISVTGNVPPILKPENTTTGQNIPLTICGLDNDFDIGGTLDASSVQILNISPSGSGTITVLPGSGCILFTPNSTFIGIVTYIYKVCDLQTPVACTTITSTITVTGTVPTTPTANPDTTTTGVNQPITVCVLCNDTGGPLDPSSVKTVGSVVGANVTIDPLTGLLTVNPNVGYFGVINFTYEVCTYAPTTCVSAMVSITVTGTGTVTGAPRANLGITVSGVGTIEIDKFITYTVTSFNFGPDTAKNVTLSLFLSKEISNVSVSNGGTYDQVTGIVQWNVTSFASGTSNAYTVLFIPKNDPILITASGIISSSTIDPDTLNNKSFASTLLIYPSEQEGLYIADGFSPDGDGINETLIIDSKGKEYTLKVFNRWGNLVYENGDYKNDWDGKPNRGLVAGEKLPSGTYFLILEFADGSKKEVKSITIMR